MHFTELDTPALIVELDVLDRNIAAMQAHCNQLGIPLRVHTKTHKTPQLAQRQMAAGAIGIACQKLGEAEVMAAAGLPDIFIPYNLVSRPKLERLSRLIRSSAATITVAADSAATVKGLAQQAGHDRCTVRVVVEMDTGGGRCGAQSPQDTLELAQLIDQLPGLEFMGVMTYPSSERSRPFLDEVRQLLNRTGLPLSMISGGGTGNEATSQMLGCTETRSGSYVYEGLTRVGRREHLHPDRCPLRLVTTVVSLARPGQIIIDAGQKAFTSYPPTPYGYCLEHPEIAIRGMSVEHGHVEVAASAHCFKVGEVLSFIPLHGGMTTNLHDRLYPVRGGEVVDCWPVAGRGRFQ